MNSKTLSRIIQMFACCTVLLSWSARGAVYVPGNIVQNGDFGYWPTGMGPANWTWTENIGAMGFGLIYGTVSQQLPTIPGQAYHLKFSMAGNPNTSAPETFNVYWENHLLGSTTWYPNGQGYQNLGWIEGSYSMVATTSPSLLTFENANSYTTGQIPFLTDVIVVPIPEPSTLGLLGFGACILARWSGRKKA